ncbi:MAG: hypothetical protein ABL884_01515 [Methyloglobulus sp.]
MINTTCSTLHYPLNQPFIAILLGFARHFNSRLSKGGLRRA